MIKRTIASYIHRVAPEYAAIYSGKPATAHGIYFANFAYSPFA